MRNQFILRPFQRHYSGMIVTMKVFLRGLARPILEFQAKRLIAKKKLKVVAVTGAVGKTSTKLAIATVLEQKYRVLAHPGNFNSDISLPLSLFNLDVPRILANPFGWLWRLIQMERSIRGGYPYRVVVLELGTDHPGEIPHFMRYLQPDIGVVTAVAPEHMENFASLDEVAKEELALAAGSKQIVANCDDIPVRYRHKYVDTHAHHFYYGLGKEANFGLELGKTDPLEGTNGSLIKDGHAQIIGVAFALHGRHAARAAAAAYGVASLMGLNREQIEKGVAALRPAPGRMNVLGGLNGSVIIDDTYNSSPEAAAAALDVLMRANVAGRRIAIMGSMNELGAESPRYHREVGELCASVDLLFTIGNLANEYLGPAAVRAGLDPAAWKPADSPYAMGEFLAVMLKAGDVVLAKGSQNGVFAEEAVKLILANPADINQLVRQSPAWLKIKAGQFADANQLVI